MYSTRAIISCSLNVFFPIFEDHFFVFKCFFENAVLLYGINQEQFVIKMAWIRHSSFENLSITKKKLLITILFLIKKIWVRESKFVVDNQNQKFFKILQTGLENLQLVLHLKAITFKDKIIRISFKNLNPS